MRIEHFKAYNHIHTWTGIVSGLFLFICFVTGALTMFDRPLNQWALQPEGQLPPIALEDYDTLIQKVLSEHPQAQHEMTVYLPAAMPQSAPVTWIVEDHNTHQETYWHASLDTNGELIAQTTSVSAIGDFMDHLHRTAGIPGGSGHDAFGTYVMGVVAALYFVALVSGLIIFLPSWFKDFLTVRRGKNRKRFWVDFHNVLGISALPFHIIIAITTVVFAYHDLFYDSLRSWIYQDTPMFNRLAPPASERNLADLATLEQMTAAVRQLEPDFEPATFQFRGLDSPRASTTIGGLMDGQWVRGPYYAYVVSDPYTAKPGYTAMLPNQPGSLAKFVNAFFTLHFGGFGGDTVRWLYFAMGISGALLFLSGNILWIETRRKRQKKSDAPVQQKRSTRVMARLTVGVCLGALTGIALSFLTVHWLPHQQMDIAWWQKFAYYSGFLLCVGWAFVQPPLQAAKQQTLLLITLASLLALSAFGSLGTTGFTALSLVFAVTVAVITGGLLAALLWIKGRETLMDKDNVWL